MKNWMFMFLVNTIFIAGLGAAELSIDKSTYQVGDKIRVNVNEARGLSESAWLGVIPSDIPHGSAKENDQHDIAYEYLRGQETATFIFDAPAKPGQYDIRLNNKEWDGEEVAFVSFNVAALDISQIKLSLNKESVYLGKSLEVAFSSPQGFSARAWIAIVPADTPHGDGSVIDSVDLGYQYIGEQPVGSVTFEAPRIAGNYHVRLIDTDPNGIELKSVPFVVKTPDADGVELAISKNKWSPGEDIEVRFVSHKDFSSQAWIGLLPSNIEHGDAKHNDLHDIDWRSIGNTMEGKLVFRAPEQKGQYDFRMHDSYTGREVASVSFEIMHSIDARYISEKLTHDGKVVLRGIYFDSDKATLRAESYGLLKQLGSALTADATLHIRIDGHTDSQGDTAYNQDLSLRRANTVKQHLVKTAGIKGGRLTVKGFGESVPVENNDSDFGRSLNRRVEIINLNLVPK